jgi:hypothetical protein
MVRLVFRPYTQVRRSICTLESLRAFTRVSPGFALLRHSSPSFGSQHVCSHSNLSLEGSWSVDGANIPPKSKDFTFIPRWEVQLRALAHMLDSLVRVSRRVVKKHFVKVFPSHDGKQFHTEITPLPRKEKSLTCRSTLLPYGSISAISGTFSLSFQSSLHLSLTVLVRYRSPTNI